MRKISEAMKVTFLRLASFVDQRHRRSLEEHIEFLEFYEALVSETPMSAVQRFGKISVAVIKRDGKSETCGLSLTALDLLWWRSEILENCTRFKNGPARVRQVMLNNMADAAEQMATTPEQRKALIEILRASEKE